MNGRPRAALLLDRWDAGLVRHPAERRMAVRASEQRQTRLAAAGGQDSAAVAELPAVRAVLEPLGQPAGSCRGDDDSDGELDAGGKYRRPTGGSPSPARRRRSRRSPRDPCHGCGRRGPCSRATPPAA
nr:hypothetical protein [Micromonospora sp. DSM 115978]